HAQESLSEHEGALHRTSNYKISRKDGPFVRLENGVEEPHLGYLPVSDLGHYRLQPRRLPFHPDVRDAVRIIYVRPQDRLVRITSQTGQSSSTSARSSTACSAE